MTHLLIHQDLREYIVFLIDGSCLEVDRNLVIVLFDFLHFVYIFIKVRLYKRKYVNIFYLKFHIKIKYKSWALDDEYPIL